MKRKPQAWFRYIKPVFFRNRDQHPSPLINEIEIRNYSGPIDPRYLLLHTTE
jgi:hypothetical protein